jgi:hypothetical protein
MTIKNDETGLTKQLVDLKAEDLQLWKFEGGPDPEGPDPEGPDPEGPDPEGPEPEPEGEGGGNSTAVKDFFKGLLKQIGIAALFIGLQTAVTEILKAVAAAKKKDPNKPIDWWKNVVNQMNTFDYKGVTDPDKIGVIQTNLVIELQTWLQDPKNSPTAASGSEAFLKVWSHDSQRDLGRKLSNMNTVIEMATYMETYVVSGVTINGGKPPFICGSAEVVDAAKIVF